MYTRNTRFTWINIVAYMAMITVNWLANSLPIAGRTTGEISALFPVPVTPASYAFSIWGLIYLLLGAYVILQALPNWQSDYRVTAVGPWFLVSCILNISWILLWHYLKITASVFLLLALVCAVALIYLRLVSAASPGWGKTSVRETPLSLQLFLYLPFRVYLGWISIASLVNITIGFKATGWIRWSESFLWSAVVLLTAGVLALIMVLLFRDAPYMLVVVWALIAIGVEQWASRGVVSWLAFMVSAGVLLLSLLLLVRSPRGYGSKKRAGFFK